MRLAGGKWGIRGSASVRFKPFFCQKLTLQAFHTRPHPYKLPSACTHWSTSKDVPLSLEQTPSEPFRRVRAGTGRASPKGVMPEPCVQRGQRPPPPIHDGSGRVQRGRTVGSSPLGRLFWYFSARGRKVQLEHVPPTFGEYTSPPSVASTARALPKLKNSFYIKRFSLTLWRPPAKDKELFIKKAAPAGYTCGNRKNSI